MSGYITSSSSTTTRVFVAIPEGPLVTGRVKEIENIESYPEDAHPGVSHEWREMDHFGAYGTGYAMCRCGAVGIMFGDVR